MERGGALYTGSTHLTSNFDDHSSRKNSVGVFLRPILTMFFLPLETSAVFIKDR